ncbi:MAG: hypothetical protein KDD33_10785 [Bdellovibrionales bacterium]|nr:hypothetical protein [Bdellovibrionales bacterium]
MKKGWMILLFMLLTPPAFAGNLKLCLHVYHYGGFKEVETAINYWALQHGRFDKIRSSDAGNGHVSISLQSNGKVLSTYGFWPDGIQKNREKLPKEGTHYVNGHKKFGRKICQDINQAGVQKLDQVYKDYKKKEWSPIANNCVAFGIEAYEKVTGDRLPGMIYTPAQLSMVIHNAQDMGFQYIGNATQYWVDRANGQLAHSNH